MRRLVKWPLAALGLTLVGLLAPIAGTEILCHGKQVGAPYQPILGDVKMRRPAANSYMTFPEWHIVYAYEGLAKTLETGDEYRFGYLQSIAGFWRAECKLLQVADEHGGANFDTRSTSYVIGPSFCLELALKALYEDTIGAMFAVFRGSKKTPQDEVARDMAHDYAAFLQQTPWYEYDFAEANQKLWAAPITDSLRGWERRLSLGIEWSGKIAYAKAIKSLVAATTGEADLEIHSVVAGLKEEQLKSIHGVRLVSVLPQGMVIKTPRYAAFNVILVEIAKRGGEMVEIAGNDNIMVSTLHPRQSQAAYEAGVALLLTLPRQGFGEDRDLLSVPMKALAGQLRKLQAGDVRLEHVYDY